MKPALKPSRRAHGTRRAWFRRWLRAGHVFRLDLARWLGGWRTWLLGRPAVPPVPVPKARLALERFEDRLLPNESIIGALMTPFLAMGLAGLGRPNEEETEPSPDRPSPWKGATLTVDHGPTFPLVTTTVTPPRRDADRSTEAPQTEPSRSEPDVPRPSTGADP